MEQSGKVIRGLEKELDAQLRYILTTHKHGDHTNGNLYWQQERPDVKILGSKLGLKDGCVPGLTTDNAMHDL